MTITEFLLARIAEDKDHASLVTAQSVDMSSGIPEIRHTAIRDRVLAECEAKEAIVKEHALGEHYTVDDADVLKGGLFASCSTCAQWKESWPCPTIRVLASVYASHPDYDEAWRAS